MKLINRNINRKGLAIAIISCLVTITSCKKFLDSPPLSQSTTGNFYQTADDFYKALNGVYYTVQESYGYFYYLLAELRGDNTTTQTLGGANFWETSRIDLDKFTETADNERIQRFYRFSYNGVQRCNAILDRIDNANMDAGLKAQYKGEAKVIRANFYYNLVRFFGAVTLVTADFTDLDATYKMGRTPVEEIYNQLIQDLKDAKSLLPLSYDNNNVGRVTKGTATSLLGDVYLTLKQYSNAVTEFKEVISSGKYQLLTNYASVFSGVNHGNSEAIWLVQFKGSTEYSGSSFASFFAPTGSDNILVNGRASGFNQPTQDLINDYETGDLRKTASIGDGYTNSTGTFIPAKYIKLYVRFDANVSNSDLDWYILRYSEVLLKCAEAINEASSGPNAESYNYLNIVRARAGLPALSGLNQTSFRTAIYHEERMETAFEGKRWFNLLRTGQALTVMNSKVATGSTPSVGISAPIQEYQLLFPLPSVVIATSSPYIQQNSGY